MSIVSRIEHNDGEVQTLVHNNRVTANFFSGTQTSTNLVSIEINKTTLTLTPKEIRELHDVLESLELLLTTTTKPAIKLTSDRFYEAK